MFSIKLFAQACTYGRGAQRRGPLIGGFIIFFASTARHLYGVTARASLAFSTVQI